MKANEFDGLLMGELGFAKRDNKYILRASEDDIFQLSFNDKNLGSYVYISIQSRMINKRVDGYLYMSQYPIKYAWDTPEKLNYSRVEKDVHDYASAYEVIKVLSRMISDDYINSYNYLASMGYKSFFKFDNMRLDAESEKENEQLKYRLSYGMVKKISPKIYMRVSLFDKYIQLCAYKGTLVIFESSFAEISGDCIRSAEDDIIAQLASAIMNGRS